MELILGLVIIGLLAFVALFFAKSRKRTSPQAGLTTEQPGPAEEGAQKPVNKANMNQPQEEFIAPEGNHATADEPKK